MLSEVWNVGRDFGIMWMFELGVKLGVDVVYDLFVVLIGSFLVDSS